MNEYDDSFACNDCKKTFKNDDVQMTQGNSPHAGGKYYDGAPICQHCIIYRRENAINGAANDAHKKLFDELLDEAVSLTRTRDLASTSFLQRSLRIGYNDAARLMEKMKIDGVVEPRDAYGFIKVVAV